MSIEMMHIVTEHPSREAAVLLSAGCIRSVDVDGRRRFREISLLPLSLTTTRQDAPLSGVCTAPI